MAWDQFVGRAIVTYTGKNGTDYTSRDNVNFKELLSCGNSECCIYDMSETRQVAVGDFLLIRDQYKVAMRWCTSRPRWQRVRWAM